MEHSFHLLSLTVQFTVLPTVDGGATSAGELHVQRRPRPTKQQTQTYTFTFTNYTALPRGRRTTAKMAKIVNISSSNEFADILKKSRVVVADCECPHLTPIPPPRR